MRLNIRSDSIQSECSLFESFDWSTLLSNPSDRKEGGVGGGFSDFCVWFFIFMDSIHWIRP